MDGVILTPLKQVYNVKGDIFHAMKKSDAGFIGFGEAYFSTIHYGEIKGWKKHSEMTMNIVVPAGEIEFVTYNEKDFEKFVLSTKNYQRLTVASGLWVAFRGMSKGLNLLLNLASLEHDPEEAVNYDLDSFDYKWT